MEIAENPDDDCQTMHQVQKFPWPMQNRDLVESRYSVRYSKMGQNEIRLINFGTVDDRFPEVSGVQRGYVHFGFKRIAKLRAGILLDMISQTDLGLAIATSEKMFCMTAKMWIAKLVKEIEKLPTAMTPET